MNVRTYDYGPELLLDFVPVSARERVGAAPVALMSGAVLAEIGESLRGPVVELSWPGVVALEGALRAIKHANAVGAVSLPPGGGGDRARMALEVVHAAQRVGMTQPLVLVSRAQPLESVDDGALERLSVELMADIQAGFTSFGFRLGEIADAAAERLADVVSPLLDFGLGIEVELGDDDDAHELIDSLDAAGLPVAAVRGAGWGDPLGGGFFIADPVEGGIPEDVPLRIIIDGFVLRGLTRALGRAEGDRLLEDAAELGIDGALAQHAAFLDAVDPSTQDAIEAFVYGTCKKACETLAAEDVADDVLDALAAEYFKDAQES